jgi:hypothetical protein
MAALLMRLGRPFVGRAMSCAARSPAPTPVPVPVPVPEPAATAAAAAAAAAVNGSAVAESAEPEEDRPFRRTKAHYHARVRARHGDLLPGEEPPGTPSFAGMVLRATPPAEPAAAASAVPGPPPPLAPTMQEGEAYARLLVPRVDTAWLAQVTPLLYRLPFPSGYFGRLDAFERNVLKVRARVCLRVCRHVCISLSVCLSVCVHVGALLRERRSVAGPRAGRHAFEDAERQCRACA